MILGGPPGQEVGWVYKIGIIMYTHSAAAAAALGHWVRIFGFPFLLSLVCKSDS